MSDDISIHKSALPRRSWKGNVNSTKAQTRRISRLAGLLWLLGAVMSGFSLVYVRPKLIAFGDAAATANNVRAFEALFRTAIASSVLSQIFSLFFGLTLFRLFKEAYRTLATVFLVSLLVSVAIGIMNPLSNIAALQILTNADCLKAFQPEQLNALAMVFLRLNNYGVGLLEMVDALYLFALGLLIIRSRCLPKTVGVLLMIGACAFPINTLTKILIPQFYPGLITQLTMILNAGGAPGTILWLLIKGIKEQPGLAGERNAQPS